MSIRKKPPYIVCPECGSHLDPGEPCDCRKDKPMMEAGWDAAQSAAQLATQKPPAPLLAAGA